MFDVQWVTPPPIPGQVQEALAEYPNIVQQVLFRRGIESRRQAERFLAVPADAVHDPFALPQMEEAVGLVDQHIRLGGGIVVFGDYDADGVTSTALLVEALTALGGSVSSYLPDRFDEGYGLNRTALDRIHESGASLVITVDCGVRGVDEIAHARALGLDVIVSDHHHPGPQLPAAQAILNPRLPGARYPFEDLAGVGLAYKLAQAVFRARGQELPVDLLELVAIGTVADLAPLRDENRVLVARGIEQLRRTSRPGLRALMEVAGLQAQQINAMHIGFGLGPRLNAAGRMESADLALELLLAPDLPAARPLAEALDRLNRNRQAETRRVVQRARELVDQQDGDHDIIFATDESFHEGVVGLAAARLMEQYYRPALVARLDGGKLHGSARSIPGFHITRALEEQADLLLDFGGHRAAAGFSLQADQAPALIAGLEAQARQQFGEQAPQRQLDLDAVVDLGQLNEDMLDWFERLEPVGQGNPPPLLAVYGAKVERMRQVGRDRSHLKISLVEDWRPYDGIAFRMGDRMSSLGNSVDLAFHYEWNEFRGVRQPQLRIIDIRPAGGA